MNIRGREVEVAGVDSFDVCLFVSAQEHSYCPKVSLQSRLLALTFVDWESQTVWPLGTASQTLSP